MNGISVIIPAYKARKFLAETLESIGAQTLPPDEVLVVDDCSPEPVDDIIAAFAARPGYPALRLLKHAVNRGQAAARNTGIRESKGEWIAFLDSDDLWAPGHLHDIHDLVIRRNADMGFCPGILFSDDPLDPSNYQMGPLTEDERRFSPLAILNRCYIIISSSIIRKQTILAAGGFDESPGMRGVEDLDLFMRMLKSGARFEMEPIASLYYRKHPESATGRVGYLARQDVKVKLRHIGWPEGKRVEKLTLLMEAHWRAATSLWIIRDSERHRWLGRAIVRSLWNPYQTARWFYRFVRANLRKSTHGL